MLERLRERFLADPGDTRAFAALEEQWFVAGQLGRSGLALPAPARRAASSRRTPSSAPGVLFRLGQIWSERRGDSDAAARCFREALAASPEQRPALRELRRIHASRAQWDMVLQLADLEIALPMRSEERAELLAETAGIWLRELRDPEQARALLERALGAGSGAAGGARGAGARLRGPGAAARSRGGLGAPGGAPSRRRARRGAGRAGRALRGTARRSQARRRALPARAHGRPPLRRPPPTDSPAIARETGQWSLLASLLERRFETAEAPAQRAEIAIEAGRLQLEKLASPERARSWWLRALGQAPEDLRVIDALAEVARALDDDTELLRCLERRAEIGGDQTPVSVLLEAASLRSDRGEDAAAASLLERALRRAPDDALVVEALSDTLTRLGRCEDLVDLLERRAELAGSDATTRAAVLAELGALQEERLGDAEAAAAAYQRAFAVDPGAPGVAAALDRLYRKTEDWQSLRQPARASRRRRAGGAARGLRVRARRSAGGAAGAAGRSGARLPERARSSIPARRPRTAGCAGSRRSAAIPTRCCGSPQREAAVTSDPARIAELARELVRGFEARGQHEPALAWAQRWAECAPESPEPLGRVRAPARGAGPRRGAGGLPRATGAAAAGKRARFESTTAGRATTPSRDATPTASECLEAALEPDPHDLESLEALAAQLERAGRIEELVRARRRLADAAPPERRAACLDALARLLAERVGDLSGAIDALKKLAACDGRTRRRRGPARAAARAGRPLRRTRRAPAGSAPRPPGRRPRGAAARSAPRADPAGSARALRRGRRALSRGAGAAQRMPRSTRRAGDGAAGGGGSLGPRRAARGARGVRDRSAGPGRCSPSNRPPCSSSSRTDRTARGARSSGRSRAIPRRRSATRRASGWRACSSGSATPARCARCSRPRSPSAAPAAAAALHERLGQLCRDRLSDARAAVHHFEAAARLAPRRPEAWRALAELHAEAGRNTELLRTLEAELATGPDPEREIGLRSRAAALLADAPDAAERVRRHWERILELDAANASASDYLIAHWESQGDASAVVELLEKRLEASDAQPRDARGEWAAQRASLRLRIAGLRATRLADPDGAIAMLEPALVELGPQAADRRAARRPLRARGLRRRSDRAVPARRLRERRRRRARRLAPAAGRRAAQAAARAGGGRGLPSGAHRSPG